MSSSARAANLDDFSVLLGGPLYRLYRRIHLAGESLELTTRRQLVLTLLAWLPLLVLCLLEGSAWGAVAQPFLLDTDVHTRLLIALPLLIAAEPHVHRRMRGALQAFLDRGLVTDAARPKFDAAVASALRLRESGVTELALLAFVYIVGVGIVWRQVVALDVDTWYRHSIDGDARISLAGWWYGLVSLPLFQFLIYRWYVRLGIWAWLLWKVSRSGLRLIPTHPDRCAGLGFLSSFCYSLVPLLLAHGALFAGVVAAGILFDGRTLVQYSTELMIVCAFALLFALGPLLVFVPTLVDAKRAGLREYGGLAQRYVHAFDERWLRGKEPSSTPLLGASDIQSLADLDQAYGVVSSMRLVPISWTLAARLAIVTLTPLAPLSLTMIADQELASMLLKLLF